MSILFILKKNPEKSFLNKKENKETIGNLTQNLKIEWLVKKETCRFHNTWNMAKATGVANRGNQNEIGGGDR